MVRKAIALDTNYAGAYVGLATACRQLDASWEPRSGWDARALAAAERALSLDRGLADAWAIRGALFFTPAQRWDAARDVAYQRKAISLKPNVKNAHFNLSFVYGHYGFLKEAIAEMDKEKKSDPMDPTPEWYRGVVLVWNGDYQKALDLSKSLPKEAFLHPRVKAWLDGTCLFYLGRPDEASKGLEDYLEKLPEPKDPWVQSTLAIIEAKSGQPGKATERIKAAKMWENRFIHFHHVAYNIGSAYALMNQNEQAIIWLKNSAEDGSPCYPLFEKDSNLKNLHGDKDFKAFMIKLKGEYERNRALLKP